MRFYVVTFKGIGTDLQVRANSIREAKVVAENALRLRRGTATSARKGKLCKS